MGTFDPEKQNKLSDPEVTDQARMYHAIAEMGELGVLVLNEENRIEFANKKVSYITEFKNDDLLGSNFTDLLVEKNRESFLSLKKEYGKFSAAFDNKTERNNLICKIYSCNQMTSKLASDFHEVYINTMERNQANKEYYYSLGYFENIRNRYPDKALFVFVYQEKKVVSVELILHNEYMGFSYLGGTDSKYYNCRPNDYLKHNIIFYLKEKGVYFFNMGGGHEINDGIFKYKKNFCIDGVFDYYIGRVIHNQTTYDQIVNSWKGVTCIDDINKYDNYLLKYHFGSKI